MAQDHQLPALVVRCQRGGVPVVLVLWGYALDSRSYYIQHACVVAGYSKNALEFEQWLATEQACRDYLWRNRYADGFICPRCGCTEAWPATRGLYRCQQCDYQVSATAETIFQGTRRPLRVWFRAIWYVVNQKQGISALGLQRVLGPGSYRTAWTWMHKLRVAMVRPGRDRLAGTVEVDETYVGGQRSGKRGRGTGGKTLVVVAAQEDQEPMGRIRLCRVPDASSKSLQGAVDKAVEPGSTVRTGGWIPLYWPPSSSAGCNSSND